MRRSRRCRWLVENGYVPRERHCLPHGRPYRRRSRWGGSAAPLPWGVRLRSPLRCPVSELVRKRWSCSGGTAWSGWKSCAENGFEKSETGKSEHRQTAGPANAGPAVFTISAGRWRAQCPASFRVWYGCRSEGCGFIRIVARHPQNNGFTSTPVFQGQCGEGIPQIVEPISKSHFRPHRKFSTFKY